ncbi:MAG: PspC domain-containing protein [Spirochaetaceae bacterium]|nr:PspC domain-containing protein [Spirochaetaceae bacterium]
MTTDDTQTHEATQASPPPQPPPARPYPPLSALRRSRTDRKLAGVSGGLGRYAGVDPLIFRILFVLLTFFGGTGLLLYAAAWLLVPADGEAESEGQRLFNGRSSSSVSTVIAIVVVLVLGLAATGAMLDTGPGVGGLGVLIVIGVIVVLLLRNGQRPAVDGASGGPYAPAYGPVPPPEPGAFGQTPGTAYAQPSSAYLPPGPPTYTAPTAPYQPPPPGPPREKSVLGRVTVSAALIVVGLMVAWNSVSDDDFKVVSVFATALAVVAGGLLVGAFVGRARGLIVLAILLTIATGTSHVADRDFSGSIGERTWVPTTVAEAERTFQLGIGDAELDLTRLPAGSTVEVVTRLGVGELRVIVPADARVVVDGEVGAGTLTLLDEETLDGTDLKDSTTSTLPSGATGSGTLITLDAEVGLGELEVRR